MIRAEERLDPVTEASVLEMLSGAVHEEEPQSPQPPRPALREDVLPNAAPPPAALSTAPSSSEGGGVVNWIRDQIGMAFKQLGVDLVANKDAAADTENAVWAAALAGKLGTGSPSAETATAIQDMVGQLMAGKVAPKISDLPATTSVTAEPVTGTPGDLATAPPEQLPGLLRSLAGIAGAAESMTPMTMSLQPLRVQPTSGLRSLNEAAEDELTTFTAPGQREEMPTYDDLTDDQKLAISQFAEVMGSGWKEKLQDAWEANTKPEEIDEADWQMLLAVGASLDGSTASLKAEVATQPLPSEEKPKEETRGAAVTILRHPAPESRRTTPLARKILREGFASVVSLLAEEDEEEPPEPRVPTPADDDLGDEEEVDDEGDEGDLNPDAEELADFLGIEGETSERRRKLDAILDELGGFNSDDVNRVSGTPFDHGMEVALANQEWYCFPDSDEAEEEAKEQVKRDYEDEPELFNGDFVKSYVYITDTYCRLLAGDLASSRMDGMSDEDIIDAADISDKIGAIDDEIAELESQQDEPDDSEGAEEAYQKIEAELDKLRDARQQLIDDAKETAESNIQDEIEAKLQKDPIGYLVDDEGLYTEDELLKQEFMSVNVDELVDDAVRMDGVAHFLAHYDGSETEADGSYWYRNN